MPPFECSPEYAALIVLLQEMRRNGVKMVLVYLDDPPVVREIGRRQVANADGRCFNLLEYGLRITTDGV